MTWRRSLLSIAAAALCGLATPALGSEGQAWLNNALSISLPRDFRLQLSHELRFEELDFEKTLLQHYVIGISRPLGARTSLGLFYKREKQKTSRGTRLEDRYYADLGWGRELGVRFELDLRGRTEVRTFRRNAANDVLRFRLRARLRTSSRLGRLGLRPFLWTELFTGHEQALRNRLGVGAVFELSEHVGVVLSYRRQDTRGREALNILFSGVRLSF